MKGGRRMEQTLLSKINGQPITIRSLTIRHEDHALLIQMACQTDDQNAYCLTFENVSMLKLSEICYPFRLSGFLISDYSSRGYQKDIRFFAEDYEDGRLSFFCEHFKIFITNR